MLEKKPRVRTERDVAYTRWAKMHQRCADPAHPSFKNYGARGITVCDRWHTFENFYKDMWPMPEGMTLERIDGSLGYSPDNVRWTTWTEQARSRRGNRLISFDGKTMTLAAWAEWAGLKGHVLWDRLSLGWSMQDAIAKPVRAYARKEQSHA